MNVPRIIFAALLWRPCTAGMAAAAAEPEAHVSSVKETMAAVCQISYELKLIEARLGKIETAVAGVNASLAPWARLRNPAGCAI